MTYQFLDEARIFVKSGDGGNGIISFRREKYVPHGGPNGGDGGDGGDVIFVANPKINTLRAFGRRVHFRAEDGSRGGTNNMTGSQGADLEVEVPVGTIVRDDEGNFIADLTQSGQRVIVAKGGRGGKGNTRFKTSTNQAPQVAERGEPSLERWLNLELKLMADVGIVGVPNAGKSTLLSVVSNAKPRIADYPFTTLVPNLGLVRIDYQDMVMADIPGLVEGAHEGIGLGHDFLRHIQRCRVLIHLLDVTAENPIADFHQINTELALFDETLKDRPLVVVVNKMDMPEAQEKWEKLRTELQNLGHEPKSISAISQQGTRELMLHVFGMLDELGEVETPAQTSTIDEMPIYDLSQDDLSFTVEKTGEGEFVVKGKRIERAVAMTYWDYDDALMRFQRILEAMGVSKALQAAGVEVGDSVTIGQMELEWAE
jgi:GTP-binding protein